MTIREAVFLAHSHLMLAELSISKKDYQIATKSCLMSLNYITLTLACITEAKLSDDKDMIEILQDLYKVSSIYSSLFKLPPSFWLDSDNLPMIKHISKFKIDNISTVQLYNYTKRVIDWGDISTYAGEDKESILQLTIG